MFGICVVYYYFFCSLAPVTIWGFWDILGVRAGYKGSFGRRMDCMFWRLFYVAQTLSCQPWKQHNQHVT